MVCYKLIGAMEKYIRVKELKSGELIVVINPVFDANIPNKDMNIFKAENDFQISRNNFLMSTYSVDCL